MTNPIEPVQRSEKLFITYDRTFATFNELKTYATFIFLGQIMRQWTTYSGPPGKEKMVPWTHSKITIDRVFKGAMAAGEEIEILQLGGLGRNGIVTMAEEYPLLIVGGRYVLFLNKSKALIPPQGVYVINEQNEVNSHTPLAVRTRLGLPIYIYDVPLKRFVDTL